MFKWVYNLFIGLIVAIVLLLVVSIFPITGNYKVLVGQSGSMEPAIHTGSIIITKPAVKYNVGDVITFGDLKRNEIPTTHRINEIKNDNGKLSYITKGDANNAPDRGEVMSSNVIGKVWFSVPYVGFIIDFIKKPIGFLLIVVIPALLIISDEVKKIWLEVKRVKAKKQKEQ